MSVASQATSSASMTPLLNGDVCKNYYMIGSTWTELGESPTVAFPTGNVVGTSQLANSTMEAFQQGPATFGAGFNCFGCHASNATNVSHVFPTLKKLY